MKCTSKQWRVLKQEIRYYHSIALQEITIFGIEQNNYLRRFHAPPKFGYYCADCDIALTLNVRKWAFRPFLLNFGGF